jgi:zinc transport system substrate-binding protein/iron/zinc/copper transport system substrate-binding protein
MNSYRKITIYLLLLVSLSILAGAKGIVASTSWVGAIAKAAGANDVTILAPIELRHPPEYDYKPQDVVKALEADYIVWAGYEPFVKKLTAAYPEIESKLIAVRTTNIPDNLVNMTRMLATKFGTEKNQQVWEAIFLSEMTSYKERATKAQVNTQKVAVSVHQAELITWLGYDVVKTFGSNQLTPADIAQINQIQPDLIIDNYNSLDGKLLAEHSQYVILFNFPTKDYPELLDVLSENIKRLGL